MTSCSRGTACPARRSSTRSTRCSESPVTCQCSLPCPGSVTKASDWPWLSRQAEMLSLIKVSSFEQQALPVWRELAAKP